MARRDGRAHYLRVAKVAPVLAMTLALGLGNEAVPMQATAAAPALPTAPANGEMDFVVVSFHPAINSEDMKRDCPDGISGTLKDHYLLTLPEAERKRLLEPGKEAELASRWQEYGGLRNGRNICTYWMDYLDRPAVPMMTGSNIGMGIDLDGDGGTGKPKLANTCNHVQMDAPDGRKGIDNQAWKVFGCSNNWRGVDGMGGDVVRGFDGFVMSGEWTQVIKLKGVNSLVNDPDVEILYANTDDRPIVDSNGRPIRGASFTVSSQPIKAKYRNVLHGRIVDGVLISDPQTIWLFQSWGQGGGFGGQRTNWQFRNGQIRLAFQPDGTLKGVVGGYQPIYNLIQSTVFGGAGSVSQGLRNCAGEYTAMMQMADGDRDPATGKCTTISSAYSAVAVPAFVTDRADKIAAR